MTTARDFARFAPGMQKTDPWAAAVDGMQRAAAHADAVEPAWGERAYEALRLYVKAMGSGVPFIAPDVRAWCERHGLPAAASNMAWGSVMRRASKDGLIVGVGFTTYGDHTMHTQSVRVWAAPTQERLS